MSVIGIRNRLGRLEQDLGNGRRPVVVVMPGETPEQAFARRGIRAYEDTHVIRLRLVSTRPA